jgi:CheY-like chemotaxis protein
MTTQDCEIYVFRSSRFKKYMWGSDPRAREGKHAVKVLIVDDDRDIVELLKLRLSSFPLEVVGEAHDGKTAVSQALELEPDVILMDHRMPVMSGAQATRVIKQRLPDTTVIGFTASMSEGTRLLIDAGAVGVFDKIQLDGLLAALERLVAS